MKIKYLPDMDCTSKTLEEFQSKLMFTREYMYLKDTVGETRLDNLKLSQMGVVVKENVISNNLPLDGVIKELEAVIMINTEYGYKPLNNMVVWDDDINEEL